MLVITHTSAEYERWKDQFAPAMRIDNKGGSWRNGGKPRMSGASLLSGQGCMKVRSRTNFATGSTPKKGGQTQLTLVERLEAIDHGIRPLELAALLGIGKTTLYDWIAAGTIPAYRHRGVVFFDPVIIAAWLRRQSTQGRSQARLVTRRSRRVVPIAIDEQRAPFLGWPCRFTRRARFARQAKLLMRGRRHAP